jgi:hypothetical protein
MEISTDPRQFTLADPQISPYERLATLIHENRLGICWAGHQGQGGGMYFLQLAERVRGAAPGVGLADVLAVTCALACPTTVRFYTTDQPLISNPNLRTLARRRRSGWVIAEAP